MDGTEYSRGFTTLGPRHSFWWSALSWTPAGPRMAELEQAATVLAWDASTAAERHPPRRFPNQAHHLTWSPDQSLLASTGPDGHVQIWNAASGTRQATWAGGGGALAWSPDGSLLAGRAKPYRHHQSSGPVRVWDPATGQLAGQLDAVDRDDAPIAWSPDSRAIACGDTEGPAGHAVRIWAPATDTVRTSYPGHPAGLGALSWSPDGRQVASAAGYPDTTVHVWDALTGRADAVYEGHTGRVTAVAWAPGGDLIASSAGDEDRSIQLWRPGSTSGPILICRGNAQAAYQLEWSPDGTRLASWSPQDATVRIWDTGNGLELAVIRDPLITRLRSLRWSPDGTGLVAAAWHGSLRIWAAPSGMPVRSWPVRAGAQEDPVWSPDGTRVATFGDGTPAEVWDAVTGRRIAAREAGSEYLAWSPDSTRLAGQNRSEGPFVWDPQSDASILGQDDYGYTTHVLWSPDGTRLASCGQDSTARVWDTRDLRLVATYLGHPGADWVRLHGWSPDGRRLLSSGELDLGMHSARYWQRNPQVRDDPRVHLWDASTGRPVLQYNGHHGVITSAAWSPDGAQAASAGQSLHVWAAASGQLISAAPGPGDGWVTWTPSGTHVLWARADGTYLADARTGAVTLLSPGRCTSLAWSPAGHELIADVDGQVRRLSITEDG